MQISLMFLYLFFGRYYLFRKILPFSEDITFFGRYYLFRSLFHSAIFHLHAFLIILLAFAGWRFSKRDANNSRA